MVEGIPLVSTVSQCFLLDAAAYLTWSVRGECDDMKGAWHAGCVLELVINGVRAVTGVGSSVAIWIPERNCLPRLASQFSCTVLDLPGIRSNRRAVG